MRGYREKFTTTFEVPLYKFSTIILIMHILNNLMDEPIYDINGDNTREGYMQMKKERYDLVLKENEASNSYCTK